MNGAHYLQQHIALGRFIKKHYNQFPHSLPSPSPVTVPCFIEEETSEQTRRDQPMKTGTETGNTFAFSFLSSTTAIPICYQNSLNISKEWGLQYLSQCCCHLFISANEIITGCEDLN